MQRYRVNYTLLIVLLVGLLVCTGGVYALWSFQVERKADGLIVAADEARSEGRYRKEIEHLRNYLSVRPDDREIELRYAGALADIGTRKVKVEGWNVKDSSNAYNLMEVTLRKYDDADELRRRQIDWLLTRRSPETYKMALPHVEQLLNRHPDDTELMCMRAQSLDGIGDTQRTKPYLFKLVGYDNATDSFDATKALAPGEVVVYTLLADNLRSDRQPELADRVMNQLIEVNAEEVEAYLQRSMYRRRLAASDSTNSERHIDEAEEDVQKAYDLDPENPDVLLAKADLARYRMAKEREDAIEEDPQYKFAEEDVAPIRKLLEVGLSKHPEDIRFYFQLIQLELMKGDRQAAMQRVEEGLSNIEEEQRPSLLLFLANLQLDNQDVAGARKSIEQLREMNLVSTQLEYLEARCLMVEERWFEARKIIEKVKPLLDQSPQNVAQLNYFLGLCCERLGQLDLAREAYLLSQSAMPASEAAEAGLARVENALGTAERSDLDQLLRNDLVRIMLLPKDEQDWSAFDKKLNEVLAKSDLPSAAKKLYRAEILMRRSEFAEARELLKQAYSEDKDNFQVRLAAIRLVAGDPERGPAQALEMLERLVKDPKFGDNFLLRLVKADLLIKLHSVEGAEKSDAKLKEQLFTLTEGIDDWNTGQKSRLWTGLGDKFAQIQMPEEAKLCRERVAEVSPNELPARVGLFKMALQENDEEGMKEAQNAILEIVGSRDSPSWLSTEAQRLLWLVSRGQGGEELINEAEDLISKARVQRREWNELLLLQAQIALMRGREAKALESYDQAMKLGQASPNDVLRYTELLVRRGRWVDARAVLEKFSNPGLLQRSNLGQAYAQVLINTGSVDEALETAEVVIEADPDNAAKQLWYGKFALQTAQSNKKFEVKGTAGEQGSEDKLVVESSEMSATERDNLALKLEKAGKALAKAVELAPHASEVWLTWIEYLAKTGQGDRAGEAIRQAQLALPEDEIPILLARSYEITGRWFDAENRYRAAMDSRPDNVQAMRWLAGFYLGNGYRLKDKQERAIPLINDILKAAAEGKAGPQNEHVMWARRIAAQMLAGTGDYQNALKSERLLNANAVDGVLAVEDQLRLAQMLSRRPEPSSRLKAEQLLTEVKRNHALSMEADMILGQLMYMNGKVSGKWDDARRHMVELIARHPNAEAPRAQFIRMLLERGGNSDLKVAKQYLGRLAEVATDSTTAIQLGVELAIKTGEQQEALQSLHQLVSRIPPDQLPVLGRVAEFFSQLEDYETAEKLYRFIAGKDSRYIPSLIVFLGTKREVKDSFDMLEQLQGKLAPPVLIQSALAVLRDRRNDVGNQFDGQVQTWLDRALRENPESITLLLQRAELHDMRGEYPQAAEIYRNLREREDVEGRERAITLNNLAFLLALGGTEEASNGEAMKLVEEAIELDGPSADILDTRAVVHNAQKQYSQAVADLEQSLLNTPTASKYFHKVVAHLGANQFAEAEQAWKEAEKLGLGTDVNALNRMEFEQYEQIKKQIEDPELRSASL